MEWLIGGIIIIVFVLLLRSKMDHKSVEDIIEESDKEK